MKKYIDERYCEKCGEYTEHEVRDAEHERDSSGDYEECLICGWWETGMSSVRQPPLDDN